MIQFRKGHVFNGPDGQGYTLKKDVSLFDHVMAEDLEKFGGAPKPEANKPIPQWLWDEFTGKSRRGMVL